LSSHLLRHHHRSNAMLKNIVWSDPSRDNDLPPGWRSHTAPSERGAKVVQFDMQVPQPSSPKPQYLNP
jgi:hypothetical protein